jgi:hypothetical protein
VAIKTGFGVPKKDAVTSSKKMLVIVSIIMVEKKAKVKDGTNSLRAEDSTPDVCCNFGFAYRVANDTRNSFCSQPFMPTTV